MVLPPGQTRPLDGQYGRHRDTLSLISPFQQGFAAFAGRDERRRIGDRRAAVGTSPTRNRSSLAPSGVRLVYNAHFSRSPKGHRHSYSVPLRPDIALSIPDGPNSGLHLFDAKFRVQVLSDAGLSGSDQGRG